MKHTRSLVGIQALTLLWTLPGCSTFPWQVMARPQVFSVSASNSFQADDLCGGPIQVIVNPLLEGTTPGSAPRQSWTITCEKSSGEGNSDSNVISIGWDETDKIAELNPNEGDIAYSQDGSSGYLSSVVFNGEITRKVRYFNDTLVLRPHGDGDRMLTKLREWFSFRVASHEDNVYVLEFDLSKISLKRLSQRINQLPIASRNNVTEVVFSSLNAARLFNLWLDIQESFQDVVEYVDWSAYPELYYSE